MFLRTAVQNYPSIIIKYPPYLFHCTPKIKILTSGKYGQCTGQLSFFFVSSEFSFLNSSWYLSQSSPSSSESFRFRGFADFFAAGDFSCGSSSTSSTSDSEFASASSWSASAEAWKRFTFVKNCHHCNENPYNSESFACSKWATE